jgi:hypothetical protein
MTESLIGPRLGIDNANAVGLKQLGIAVGLRLRLDDDSADIAGAARLDDQLDAVRFGQIAKVRERLHSFSSSSVAASSS